MGEYEYNHLMPRQKKNSNSLPQLNISSYQVAISINIVKLIIQFFNVNPNIIVSGNTKKIQTPSCKVMIINIPSCVVLSHEPVHSLSNKQTFLSSRKTGKLKYKNLCASFLSV